MKPTGMPITAALADQIRAETVNPVHAAALACAVFTGYDRRELARVPIAGLSSDAALLKWNAAERHRADHSPRWVVTSVPRRARAMLAAAEQEDDVMALLVELRTAAKRSGELTVAHRLGPEFSRYLGEFYKLPAERQPPVLEALIESRRQEQVGDPVGAIQSCEAGLRLVPNYLPLLDRLARLEGANGDRASAERYYICLLNELDRLDFKLASLPPEARPVVDEISRLILEKILLTPTEQLKSVGDDETLSAYSEALFRLFGLGERAGDAPGRGRGRVEPFTRPKVQRR